MDQTQPNPTPEPSRVAPAAVLAPLLPKGRWVPWPGTERPKMVRQDRPQPLWRPADGAVAVPALRAGDWAYALISRQDAPWVLACNWYVSKAGYAVRNAKVDGRKFQQYLHRLVRCVADGKAIEQVLASELVDHKNVRPLDCRRQNLRWSDPALNSQNTNREHAGVTWNDYRHRWTARITWQGRDIHVIHSRSKAHAIRARRARCIELGIPIKGEVVEALTAGAAATRLS